MEKSKRYSYEYEEWDAGKDASTMLEDILADPEFGQLEELIIGCWGEMWEDSCQPLIDGIIAQKERFTHIKRLFIGDVDYEECEVSWIIQGDYSGLWAAMPQLESLTVKGSSELVLGDIEHRGLKELQIICGGLPDNVLLSIQNAKLPSLEKLILYIGVEDYGFEGSIEDIKTFLSQSDFPSLKYLGVVDSEIQDEIAEVVVSSKYMKQITTLDLSLGTLTDKGGEILLAALVQYPQITKLDLQYHFLSDAMMKKLESLQAEVCLDDKQVADEYDGELYYYPMLTE